MARYAELADGRKLEFPDDTSDDVIRSTVKKVLGTAQPQQPEAQSDSLLSGEPGSWNYAAQGAGAGPEAFSRGIAGFGASIVGGIGGAIANPSSPLEGGAKGAETANQWIEENIPRVFAPTKSFEQDLLVPGFEKIKSGIGSGLEALEEGRTGILPVDLSQRALRSVLSPETQGKRSAAAMTLGEVGFDVAAAAGLGKSVGQGLQAIPKGMKARRDARDAADAKREAEIENKVKETRSQESFEQGEGGPLTLEERPVTLKEREAAKEKIKKEQALAKKMDSMTAKEARAEKIRIAKEQRAQKKRDRDIGKRSIYPEDQAPSIQERGIDPYAPRDPFTGPELPFEQRIQKTAPGGERLREPVQPTDYGQGVPWQIREGLDPRQPRTTPGEIPFENTPPPRISPDFAEPPRGQGEGLPFKQETGSRVVDSEIGQNFQQNRYANRPEPQPPSNTNRWENNYDNYRKGLEQERAARSAEEARIEQSRPDPIRQQIEQAEASGQPMRIPGGKPRVIPKGQRGSVNPDVFIEGFEKIKKLANGFKIVISPSRDFGYTLLKAKVLAPGSGAVKSEVQFYPTAKGLAEIKTGDLFAVGADTTPSFQGRGFATEIYKAVAELGNDIIRSDFQTKGPKGTGEAMWKGFEAKGLVGPDGKFRSKPLPPLSQRGALDLRGAKEGAQERLQGLINRASRRHLEKNKARVEKSGETNKNYLAELNSKVDTIKEHIDKIRGVFEELPSISDARGAVETTGAIVKTAVKGMSDPASLYRWTRNETVKWWHETMRNIDVQKDAWVDLKKEEFRVVEGHFAVKPRKIVHPESVHGRHEALGPKGNRQVAEISNRINREDGVPPNRDALLEEGFSVPAVDFIMKKVEKEREALRDRNETAKRAREVGLDRKDITEKEAYVAQHRGEGSYELRLRDKNADATADSLYYRRFKTPDAARAVAKTMIEEAKAKGIEVEAEYSYARRGSGRDFQMTPQSLRELQAALEKSDPRREVLEQIWRDVRGKGLAGGHSIRRRHVLGGELTAKDNLVAFDRYIDQMGASKKALEIDIALKEIQNADASIPKNLKEWMETYAASQKMRPEFMSKFERWADVILDKFTRGMFNSSNAAIRFSNKLMLNASLMMLNPAFGVASWAQSSMMTWPVLKSYLADHPNMKGSAAKAQATAYVDMLYPSKDQVKFMKWQSARGDLEPLFTHTLSNFGNKVLDTAVDYLGLAFLPKSGERFGRTHGSLAGYNLLYENGMRGKELWTEASRMSREIMGDYSNSGKAALIRDHGLLGEAISPLTTFYNWYLNMTGVMLNQVIRGKPGPALAMFVSGTMFAGMIGAPFFKEVDAIYSWVMNNVINKPGSKRVPSMTEALMETQPDWMVYGLIDGVLTKAFTDKGIRMSGSMMAPTVHVPGQGSPGLSTFQNLTPGLSYVWETVDGLSKLGKHGLSKVGRASELTHSEFKDAWKQITPGRALDALWDNMDENFNIIGLDKPGLTQSGPQGHGNVRREDPEDFWASEIGGGTLPENRERTTYGEFRGSELDRIEDKTKVMALIVDKMITGTFDQGGMELISKAIELGVPYGQIQQAIKQAMMNRDRTKSERAIGRGRTSSQSELLRRQGAARRAGGS